LNGVALATLIASTIVAFYSYAFVGRWIGISLIPRRTLALYVALWVAGGILTYLFRPSGIAFLVLTVLVGYLGLSREEKGLLRTYLRFRGRTPGGLMEP
jgi:hypothetical protein